MNYCKSCGTILEAGSTGSFSSIQCTWFVNGFPE